MSQSPALFITKEDQALQIFSDTHAGQEAWVLDWDNNMEPTPLSAVVANSRPGGQVGMGHRLKIQPMTPGARVNASYLQENFRRSAVSERMTGNGRHIILAALRSLQLHIEKGDLPSGIQESHFEDQSPPTVEQLDQLCEALNFA